MPIEENKFLFSLNYADDQVIIAQDAEDLEFILKKLKRTYKKCGLTTNFCKTEFIAINTGQEFEINIKNVTVKQVHNLNYLGISLNKKGINSKDSINKICKGTEIIGCLNSLWRNKNISLDKKNTIRKSYG